MRFVSASRTHVGLRRALNEDRVLDRAEGGFWVVADGMGGHDAGEVASAAVVEALAQIPAQADLETLAGSALEALQEVNSSLIELAKSGLPRRTIGTTVVGLAIADGEFRCFWAGDSRTYRVRGETITQLTRDHSLVHELVVAGMLAAEDAESHPDAHVVTRAVGASSELKVDVVAGDALPGDIFLLASDGLTRVVRDSELLNELRTRNPMQAADCLLEMVLSRGAPDNVSMVICRLA